MNISICINYSPASLADFLKAVESVPKGVHVNVSSPSVIEGPIARYCALRGQQRYMRLQENKDKGLTPIQDLQSRAEKGDEMAQQALQGELLEMKEREEPEFLQADIPVPENGEVF